MAAAASPRQRERDVGVARFRQRFAAAAARGDHDILPSVEGVGRGRGVLTDDVLYGDVWERPQLSKRDRSLATVAALIGLNRPEQLRSHLALARENGVTQQELIETITHLAFYSG